MPSRVSLQCKVRRLPGTTRGLGIRSAIGRIRVCIGKAPCFKRFEKAKVAQILSSDASTSMVPDQTSKADEAGRRTRPIDPPLMEPRSNFGVRSDCTQNSEERPCSACSGDAFHVI